MAQRAGGGLRTALIAVAVLAIVFVAAGGAAFALMQTSDDGPSTALAERVPADTQVYLEVDLDLTSDGWQAVFDILDALEVRERLVEERDGGLAEEGFDWATDFEPVLAEMVATAQALTLNDNPLEDPLVVGIVETRDVPGLLALVDRIAQVSGVEAADRTDSRDDDLGLDVRIYPPDVTQEFAQVVIASDDRFVYVASDLDHIRRVIREAEAAPLSEVAEFQELRDAAPGGLLYAYIDIASLVDAFEEMLLEEADAAGAMAGADFDEQLRQALNELPTHFASSLDASEGGLASELLWLFAENSSALGTVAAKPDVERVAAATPRDALIFATGADLGPTLLAALDELREQQQQPEFGDLFGDFLADFEGETGVDLADDLLAQLTGTFAFSVGIDDFDASEPAFVLFEVEGGDRETLLDGFRELRRTAEQFCGCDSNVGVGSHAGFAYVGWPEDGLDAILDGGALTSNAGYAATRSLLHDEPDGLFFLDLASILDEVVAQQLLEGDPSLEEWNPAALRGLGASSDSEGRVGRARIVVPIASLGD